MNLITLWYRAPPLVPTAQFEIVFTDKVAVVARTRFLQHIEKHYDVQSRWVSVDKLHVQVTSNEITSLG